MDGNFLLSDDLMPNDGESYRDDVIEVQKQAESQDRARIVAAGPLIDEILSSIDSQIASLSSVESIDLTNGVSAEAQILGHQIATDLLKGVRLNIEARRNEYLK